MRGRLRAWGGVAGALAFLLTFSVASAAPTVTLSVEKREVRFGERFRCTVVFEGLDPNQDQTLKPDFKRFFEVVGEFSQNVGTRAEMTVMLRPKYRGKLQISAPSILRKGEVVARGEPVDILVPGRKSLQDTGARITFRALKRRVTLDEELDVVIEVALGKAKGKAGPEGLDHEAFDVIRGSVKKNSRRGKDAFGNPSRVQRFALKLRPKREGKMLLGPLFLVVDKEIVATSGPLSVEVVAPPPLSAAEARDARHIDPQKVALRSYTPRDSYYLSEPFPLFWELVEPRRSSGGRVHLENVPSLEGFTTQDLEEPGERRDERLRGTRVSLLPLRTTVARAFRAGEQLIAPMKVTIRRGDLFRRGEQSISSRPFTLTIKNLPTAGKPAKFPMAHVGDFQVSVEWPFKDGDTIATQQRIGLRVVIEGTGNLEGLQAPRLVVDADNFGVEEVSDRGSDQLTLSAEGIQGHRVFKYRLTPRTPGEARLPTLHFDFFSPTSDTYHHVEAKGPQITVTGTPVLDTAQGLGYSGHDIGPILQDDTLAHTDRHHRVHRDMFWWFFLAPLAFLLLSEGRDRLSHARSRDPAGRQRKHANRQARLRLKGAEEALKAGEAKHFFDALSRTLVGYLEEKLTLATGSLTHASLRREAVSSGLPPELVGEVINELENCDFARFAPRETLHQQMGDSLARVHSLLGRLEQVRLSRGNS